VQHRSIPRSSAVNLMSDTHQSQLVDPQTGNVHASTGVLNRNEPQVAGRRLEALDGLRSLAVAWVVLFHYCHFWTPAGTGIPLVAYGDTFAKIPFVSVGYLGVHLFFVISGFVILLTLDRMKSLREFLIRRVIRLWPALIVCGTATFVIVGVYGPEEIRVGWWEYLLSLIVLPPQHLALLVGGNDWKWLDGAYWSLWVEVKFYCIIGVMYFWLGRYAIAAWIAFELFTVVIGLLNYVIGGSLLDMIDGFFFQAYVPYFSFGLAAYLAWSGRSHSLVTCVAISHAVLVSALHLAQEPTSAPLQTIEFVVGQVAIFFIFYLLAWRRMPLSIFTWSPLSRTGRASYGIYLLHQNLGITVLSAAIFAGALPGLLGLLLVVLSVTIIALVVFKWIELPIQKALTRRFIEAPQLPGIHAVVCDRQVAQTV
jgi:peptidoglycan/LPS O-acetylase OafA/YrhL